MAIGIRRIILALVTASAMVAGGRGLASAEDDVYPFRGMSLGPRFSLFMPADGSSGWTGNGGAQMRAHMNRFWALEASAEYRKRDLDGSRVNVIPIQVSLLAYPFPNRFHISPYILAGGGWYRSRAEGAATATTRDRFGPHLGAGIQVWLNRKWSLDAGARHIWLEDVRFVDGSGTARRYRDDSHHLTAGLNYHF